ncbi:hypothetical protein INR49_022946, partial [Caranx melampygus]
DLSIGRFCDQIAIVEHEFLHALGFYHEQSRYDRDDHVTIALENVQEDAFSNGNGSTIITKDPKFQDVIGQRLEVSPTDIRELNLRYKC